MAKREPIEIDAVTGEVSDYTPAKSSRYRVKLDTQAECRAEMAKLYRECRSDLLDPAVGTKLVWMLKEISRAIAEDALEKRVAALESKADV